MDHRKRRRKGRSGRCSFLRWRRNRQVVVIVGKRGEELALDLVAGKTSWSVGSRSIPNLGDGTASNPEPRLPLFDFAVAWKTGSESLDFFARLIEQFLLDVKIELAQLLGGWSSGKRRQLIAENRLLDRRF